MSTFEATVERVTTAEYGDQLGTERGLLSAFHDELAPDDTVWVLGAREGLYAALAAEAVGPEDVAVLDDDPAAVREDLAGVGVTAVTVAPPSAANDGDETSLPGPPTVVVVDEPALADGPALALAGRLSSVRYLLVKGDDDVERRLRSAGYETSRLRRFDPLRTPWTSVVEGRTNPALPVTPVASRLFDAPVAEAPPGGLRRAYRRLGRRFTRAATTVVPDYDRRPLAHVVVALLVFTGVGGGAVGGLVGLVVGAAANLAVLGSPVGPLTRLVAWPAAAVGALCGLFVYVGGLPVDSDRDDD